MTTPGRLDVFIASQSQFSQHTLPYIVRDSHLTVVHEGKVGDEPIELKEGLYSVDLLTHAGVPASSVIMIAPEVTTHIRIAADGAVDVSSGELFLPPGGKILDAGDSFFAGPVMKMAEPRKFDVDVDFDFTPTPEIEVEESWSCQIRSLIPGVGLVLEPIVRYPNRQPDTVPSALFKLGDDHYDMSLPLNQEGTRPDLRACAVNPVREYGRDRIRVSFLADRELCVMMDGLVRSNAASSAVEMFEAASDLVTGEYTDPVGAALGGLTLHRLGRLRQPEEWVMHLAEHYPWLPDGQILCAALLMQSPKLTDRSRGLDLLLSATQNRPLYTDALSLAMELLRRWPDPEQLDMRTERLEFLAARWALADWDAVNLTIVPPRADADFDTDSAAAITPISTFVSPDIEPMAASILSDDIDPAHPQLEPAALAVLTSAGIFQGLEAAAVSALMTQLQPAHFPAGKAIFAEGEPGDRLFIVISGKVKIGKRADDGRENLITVMGPSDMFGELAIFDPGPRTATATAITEVDAASMDQAALRTWIADRPEIAEQLLRVLARRLRRTNNSLADLIFTDVPGRVAKQLLDLAMRFGTQEGGALRVTHDLTQEEIAQLVGASRETVNKALADFVHRGWIRLEGKSVLISNAERLNQRAR